MDYTKFVLSSEFKSDSNALIFSLIERELSELCEFYKLYPKMVNFHAAPSVPQIAVTSVSTTKNLCAEETLYRTCSLLLFLQLTYFQLEASPSL